MDITNIHGGITCPGCGWKGQIIDLRVNKYFNMGCPECEGLINKYCYGIDINVFMGLPLVAKPFFVCHNIKNGNKYDFMFFDKQRNPDMRCDICGDQDHELTSYLFGTPDTREPKYCPQHYGAITKNCRFVKEND
jgi:hypothetical protein